LNTTPGLLEKEKSRAEEKKQVQKDVMAEIFAYHKKPQFFNDPKLKAKIQVGKNIFERKYGRD
jgi:hypothetical protein